LEKKKMREILDWVLHIGIALVIGFLIVTFVGQRTIVYDISMEPTLVEGDNLLVEKLGYRFGWLKRGDIIVFQPPWSDKRLIKRLIAVEGDTVQIKDGKVYVNGELFLTGLSQEPVTPDPVKSEYNNLTIPEGMYYVLGDNRQFSEDSTEIGPIKKEWVKGRAILRLYPFDKFGSLK